MNQFKKNITNEELNQLPLIDFQGNTHIIDNNLKANQYRKYFESITDFVGFDTETKPSFKKGKKNLNLISLIQIATKNDVFLFRINKIEIPDYLIDFFQNPEVKKIGVAINDDLKGLNLIKDFSPAGFIDLSSFVNNFEIEANGLKKIAGIVLNARISKSQQLSNWEKKVLTPAQISYAATDAWICYKIYEHLIKSV
ncbi:MAG: 3'-5' exonuclease [Marinilabiliales bacterium]